MNQNQIEKHISAISRALEENVSEDNIKILYNLLNEDELYLIINAAKLLNRSRKAYSLRIQE